MGLGSQLQPLTLCFLIGGLVIAALGSQLQIPDAIYPSAAQLILPSGGFAAIASGGALPITRLEDQTRRRIEIRFTRLGKAQEVK